MPPDKIGVYLVESNVAEVGLVLNPVNHQYGNACKATQSPGTSLSLPSGQLRGFDSMVFSRHHLLGLLRGISIVAPVTTALRPVRPPTNTRIMDCTNAACVVHPSRFPIQDISGMAEAIKRNFEGSNSTFKVGDGVNVCT